MYRTPIPRALLVMLCITASARAAEPHVIRNERLTVTFNEDRALFTVQSAARTWVSEGKLRQPGGNARIIVAPDQTFGAGQAIEVAYADGSSDQLRLFPKLPFVI